MNLEMFKQCSRCREIKPISLFYKRTDRIEKTRSDCKDCFKSRTAESTNKRTSRILKFSEFHRLNNLIGTSIRQALRENYKKSKYEAILGYTLSDLRDRLQSTIPNGFSWNDFGLGILEVDHIKPKFKFHFSDINDFQLKECWSLDNLRLITREDNLARSKR